MVQPIAPDMVYQLSTVSKPRISLDGGHVVFVRSTVDAETAEVFSRLMMTELPGGSTVRFTAGPKDGNPAISPDGKNIAFTRPDDSWRPQIWLISTAGGED